MTPEDQNGKTSERGVITRVWLTDLRSCPRPAPRSTLLPGGGGGRALPLGNCTSWGALSLLWKTGAFNLPEEPQSPITGSFATAEHIRSIESHAHTCRRLRNGTCGCGARVLGCASHLEAARLGSGCPAPAPVRGWEAGTEPASTAVLLPPRGICEQGVVSNTTGN